MKDIRRHIYLIACFLILLTHGGVSLYGQGIDMDKQLEKRAKEQKKDDSDADRHGGNLRSIFLSPRTGDAMPAFIDTLKLNYFHRAFVEGRSIAEAFTGTFASPYLPMVYFDRPTNRWGDFYFTLPYYHLLRKNKRMQWYDTKVPYTFLSYTTIGIGQNREETLTGTFTSNLGKQWNLGGDIDIDYAEGIYANTASSNITYRVFASYQGERYQAYASVGNTNTVNQESGGITDMRYVTHPDDFVDGRRALLPKDIPTKYRSTWNRVVYGTGRLHHKYSLGFYRDLDESGNPIEPSPISEVIKSEITRPKDSLELPTDSLILSETPTSLPDSIQTEEPETPRRRTRAGKSTGQAEAPEDTDEQEETEERPNRIFIPVTNIFHDFVLEDGRREFVSRDPAWEEQYPNPIIPRLQGTTNYPNDRIYALKIANTLGVELLEGFHDWAKMGIAAFVAFDYKHFKQPLISPDDAFRLELPEEALESKENTTYVGGRISSDSFKYFSYYAWGQVGVAGTQAGEIDIRGELATHFPLFKREVSLKGTVHFLNTPPSYFLRRYKASLLEWDQDLSMIQTLRVGGELNLPMFGTRIHANFETLQNPIFVNAEAKPEQKMTNARVLAVGLDQKLSWKALNWENSVVWQETSDASITPLPTLAIYSNLYLKTLIAKVMTMQLGVDAKWHTKYYPPYYEPVTQLFRPQTEVELGGEIPLLSAYVNFHLKRARFFVVYHNVGALIFRPNHFTMPYYPTYPPSLRLGIAVDLRN